MSVRTYLWHPRPRMVDDPPVARGIGDQDSEMTDHRDKIIEMVWGNLIEQRDMLQRFRNGDVAETVLIGQVLDALTTGPLFEEMVGLAAQAMCSEEDELGVFAPVLFARAALRAALGAREA